MRSFIIPDRKQKLLLTKVDLDTAAPLGSVLRYIDELMLEEKGNNAAAKYLAHALEVAELDVAETPIAIKVTFEDDAVDLGTELQELC